MCWTQRFLFPGRHRLAPFLSSGDDLFPFPFDHDRRHAPRAAVRLREVSREIGRPLEQIAVNWLATQPGMGPVIAGAETVAQLEATAGAGSWQLTASELAMVEAAAAA